MKKDIINLQASIRDRIKNKAKETNRQISEVMQYYAMERFLYRLSQSQYANKFVLKGALMFTVWQVPDRRATLDIDFLARHDNQIESIAKVIKEVCRETVAPDGLNFDPETVSGKRIRENADYSGVRINFICFLERSRIPMQIDVGFGDLVYPKPLNINYPVILDLPGPRLKGYTIESVISEKFEAMVKLGLLNSRMKDFYDVWIMIRQFEFKGSELAEALQRTFDHRKALLPTNKPIFAEQIYDEKSDRQQLWKIFLNKSGIKHAPRQLSKVAREIEVFLVPPLNAINKEKEFKSIWKASGPWY